MTPLTEEVQKQEIINQLTWDDSVNANDIKVKISDGAVQLSGKVANYTEKLAAERNAAMVRGIRSVDNYLKVEFPPKVTLPSDNEITENINKMLGWNTEIISSDIQVSTNEGMVTLNGVVNSFWEKLKAEDIANSAIGVVGIINKIRVGLAKTVVDSDIESDIREAYKRSIFIDEDKIDIEVKDGKVHLTGSVANYTIKKEAFEIAIYTTGVSEVIDEITIE